MGPAINGARSQGRLGSLYTHSGKQVMASGVNRELLKTCCTISPGLTSFPSSKSKTGSGCARGEKALLEKEQETTIYNSKTRELFRSKIKQ
jgi:hypothetical protein